MVNPVAKLVRPERLRRQQEEHCVQDVYVERIQMKKDKLNVKSAKPDNTQAGLAKPPVGNVQRDISKTRVNRPNAKNVNPENFRTQRVRLVATIVRPDCLVHEVQHRVQNVHPENIQAKKDRYVQTARLDITKT